MNLNEEFYFSKQIKSFDVALGFSKYLSHIKNTEILLKIINNLYAIKSPVRIFEEDSMEYLKFYTSYSKNINNEAIELLDKNHLLMLQSKDHIYIDKINGLTWDKSRNLYEKISEIPKTNTKLLNLVHFGGHSDWRIPTIEEIHTITPEIYNDLNLTKENINYPGNIWSNFVNGSDDDGRFVRLNRLLKYSPTCGLNPPALARLVRQFPHLEIQHSIRPVFCLSRPISRLFFPHTRPCRRICPRLRSRVRL